MGGIFHVFIDPLRTACKNVIFDLLGGGGGGRGVTPLKEKIIFFPLGWGALHVEVFEGGHLEGLYEEKR